LFDFAKYSWLTSLKQRSFSDVDIIVLSALVSPKLVGIYAVAWSISKFLTLFGNAVRNTLFPEISYADAQDDGDRIAQLTTDSLAYIGLVTIPGLVGGVILADRLLAIYGDEFTAGATILVILIFAVLVYGYQQHLMGVLRAIDRPDLAFRINIAFILTNLVLNVFLVYLYGWIGAAVATAISAILGLGLAFRTIRNLVDFEVPWAELYRQFAAAGVMGITVFGAKSVTESLNLVRHNAAMVVGLVVIGATAYFVVLLAISNRFRDTVVSNSPIKIPLLS
jgi:O-antigen/teichoic acid export membrane protein